MASVGRGGLQEGRYKELKGCKEKGLLKSRDGDLGRSYKRNEVFGRLKGRKRVRKEFPSRGKTQHK